tara:strand:+ start:2516 stop:3190 length:675 start_codon:yes stop_codon:yes gene_type:complete
MDHGTDAALASRYHAEHQDADITIAASKKGVLGRIRDSRARTALLKTPLCALLDSGYTPRQLVSSGVTWSSLCKAYGATALLENGFTWEHARAAGITAEQACSSGLAAFNITADELMETSPTIKDIASLNLPVAELKKSGFTMDKLTSMGLTSATMRRFGDSLLPWSDTYTCDWKSLGFISYEKAEKEGWLAHELHQLGVIGGSAQAAAVQPAVASGGRWSLEF